MANYNSNGMNYKMPKGFSIRFDLSGEETFDYRNMSAPGFKSFPNYNLELGLRGENPFVLNSSSLGDKPQLISKPSILFSNELSDSNGEFSHALVIKLKGKNIQYIGIDFNYETNVYAKEFYINDVFYTNSDLTFETYLEAPVDMITIKIVKINKANALASISGIYSLENKVFSGKEISNVTIGKEISNQERTDYGIVGGYANFDLLYTDETIMKTIEDKFMNSNPKIEIYFNRKIVATMYAEDISDTSSDKKISFSLRDMSREFEGLTIDPIDYNPSLSSEELLSLIVSYTRLKGYKIEGNLREVKFIDFYTTQSVSFQTILNSFCETTLSNCYINEFEELVVISDE